MNDDEPGIEDKLDRSSLDKPSEDSGYSDLILRSRLCSRGPGLVKFAAPVGSEGGERVSFMSLVKEF